MNDIWIQLASELEKDIMNGKDGIISNSLLKNVKKENTIFYDKTDKEFSAIINILYKKSVPSHLSIV